MRKFILATALALLGAWLSPIASIAQTPVWLCLESIDGKGQNNCWAVSATNPLPVSASVSVGGFAPSGNVVTPLSVSNSSSNVALPSGSPTTIQVDNVGSTDAYVQLGTSNAVAATTSDMLVPARGTKWFTVGANTYIAAITASSTTTLNVQGGSGLGAGVGGYAAASGGTSATDEAAFTAGTTPFGPAGGFYQTTATSNALTNGQGGWWQMTANRAGFVNLRNSSGAEIGVSGAPVYTIGTGSAGTAATGVLTIQGIASMTPVQVSQATASNLNATVVGAGTAGSPSGGVVSVQGVASGTVLPANVSQIGGSALALGSTTASAAIPVVLASNQTAADPCQFQAKIPADFESSSSGGSIITAVSAKKAYICSVSIVTSTAANVSLIEGTGSSVCTGGTPAGVFGNTGVTAANGMAFAANGGINSGGAGNTIAQNATANQNICVAFTTTNSPQVNVHVTYVQQ